jgi:hypothetical protein
MKDLIAFCIIVSAYCWSKSNVSAATKVFHAWNTLRHEPKWTAERESRNGKNNVEAANGADESNPNAERPPGRRKAEKAARKRLGWEGAKVGSGMRIIRTDYISETDSHDENLWNWIQRTDTEYMLKVWTRT